MRYLLLFFTFFCLLKPCSAQDTIIKVNGVVSAVKILEISDTDIKYKKANFLDGPTYIESKSGIRTIIYSNGTREEITAAGRPVPMLPPPVTDNNTDYYSGPVTPKYKIQVYGSRYTFNNKTINERELHRVLQNTKDKEILALVQTSKDAHKLKFIGFAAFPLGLASLVVLSNGINQRTGYVSAGTVTSAGLLFAGAIACPIISGIYAHKRTLSNRRAIRIYNEKY